MILVVLGLLLFFLLFVILTCCIYQVGYISGSLGKPSLFERKKKHNVITPPKNSTAISKK